MLSAKDLLLKQTAEAFSGRPDMPLMASLEGITPEEAAWSPGDGVPSIEQLVRHIAWAKSRYCQEGFGTAMVLDDATINGDGDSADLPWEFPCGAAWGATATSGIGGAIELLKQAHAVLTRCLESCSDEALEQPIPVRHGKTASHFFWIMIMHDLYHAGTIRTRRTMWKASRIG